MNYSTWIFHDFPSSTLAWNIFNYSGIINFFLFFLSRERQASTVRWLKSIESNDILRHRAPSRGRRQQHETIVYVLKTSTGSSVLIRRWKLPLWTTFHPLAVRCAASIYQRPSSSLPSPHPPAETGCRFHEILPVMSAASITRHYPSISRFPRIRWTLRKRTFRRSRADQPSSFTRLSSLASSMGKNSLQAGNILRE